VTNISSAISSAALKPSVPTLTPSLANYFREDLITHVTGWQADHAERQVFLSSSIPLCPYINPFINFNFNIF
jgi:hypothetical protein